MVRPWFWKAVLGQSRLAMAGIYSAYKREGRSGGKCAGLRNADVADGGELVFGDCDAASKWEVLGNGQLKLTAPGDLCLSQSGLAPGRTDVAAKAAVMASSTANAISHGSSPFLPTRC